VGKSSLLNALLGFERAITSPLAGTTRDLVRVVRVWNGYPLELIDTAGLGSPGSELEAAGIELAREAFIGADVLLWLVDLSNPGDQPADGPAPAVIVGTKSDLPRASCVSVDYEVSAIAGTGIQELLDGILKTIIPEEPKAGQAIPITSADREKLKLLEIRANVGCGPEE
jgi:tRNA modification GTPase